MHRSPLPPDEQPGEHRGAPDERQQVAGEGVPGAAQCTTPHLRPALRHPQLATRREAEVQQQQGPGQQQPTDEVESGQTVRAALASSLNGAVDRQRREPAEREVDDEDPAPGFVTGRGADDAGSPERSHHPAKGIDGADDAEGRGAPGRWQQIAN